MKKDTVESNINAQLEKESNFQVEGKRNKRKILLITICVIILLLIGFRLFQSFGNHPLQETKATNVKISKVEYASIESTSPVTGRIEPIEEVSVLPMASGEVTSVNVKIGDRVSKGTVLFEIDKTQISASNNQASAAYSLAKSSYERMGILYKEGAVSMQDFEQSKVQYEAALASYTVAGEAYSNTSVKSPIDGFVTSMNVSAGSMASPGVPAASVADVSGLVINTSISEYLVGQLKTGDSVEIYISTLGEKTFKGTINALSPAPATGTLTYPVEISVNDETGVIKAGMFAEIRIVSAAREKVLAIPSDSVIIKNGDPIVVVIKNHIPKYRTIKTGLDNGTYVEVIDGLKEGEIIVKEGQQFITENVKVNIVK